MKKYFSYIYVWSCHLGKHCLHCLLSEDINNQGQFEDLGQMTVEEISQLMGGGGG